MNHEGREGREDRREREGFKPFSMRLPSPLSDDVEQAMTDTIGCAIAVHKALGPGFLESIYKKAMHIEMNARGIAFEAKKAVTVRYRDEVIRDFVPQDHGSCRRIVD